MLNGWKEPKVNVKDIGEDRAQISKNTVYRGYLHINKVNINRAPFWKYWKNTHIKSEFYTLSLEKYIKSVLKKKYQKEENDMIPWKNKLPKILHLNVHKNITTIQKKGNRIKSQGTWKRTTHFPLAEPFSPRLLRTLSTPGVPATVTMEGTASLPAAEALVTIS